MTFLNSYLKTTTKYRKNMFAMHIVHEKRIRELKGFSNRYNKTFIRKLVARKTDKDTWFLLNTESFAHVIE